eukprot:scaffold176067_cov21-Tisochrysis_lutea.AAC.1
MSIGAQARSTAETAFNWVKCRSCLSGCPIKRLLIDTQGYQHVVKPIAGSEGGAPVSKVPTRRACSSRSSRSSWTPWISSSRSLHSSDSHSSIMRCRRGSCSTSSSGGSVASNARLARIFSMRQTWRFACAGRHRKEAQE